LIALLEENKKLKNLQKIAEMGKHSLKNWQRTSPKKVRQVRTHEQV
jgi:hypothetical protein